MKSQNLSNELLDLFLQGIQEMYPLESLNLPQPGLLARDESQFDEIINRLNSEFGYASARGLFLRSGAAAFKYLVRTQGKAIGIDDLDFRLQPQRVRLMDGLNKMIGLLEKWQAAKFSVLHAGDDVKITMRALVIFSQNTSSIIWLHFLAGLFQEFLYWAGGGKQYPFQISPMEPEDDVIIQFRLLPVD